MPENERKEEEKEATSDRICLLVVDTFDGHLYVANEQNKKSFKIFNSA